MIFSETNLFDKTTEQWDRLLRITRGGERSTPWSGHPVVLTSLYSMHASSWTRFSSSLMPSAPLLIVAMHPMWVTHAHEAAHGHQPSVSPRSRIPGSSMSKRIGYVTMHACHA